jgi:hypothetical protein
LPALREWQLFIDETGEFVDPAASVSVIGWLVQHRQNREFDQSLRSALGFVFPDAAWSPHASVLNLPISQAVVFRLFGHAKAEDKRWIKSAPEVWRGLSAVDDEAVREVVRLAESGRFASYDILRRADAALPGAAPRLFSRLRAQRGARAERMVGLLECVRDCFGPESSAVVPCDRVNVVRAARSGGGPCRACGRRAPAHGANGDPADDGGAWAIREGHRRRLLTRREGGRTPHDSGVDGGPSETVVDVAARWT